MPNNNFSVGRDIKLNVITPSGQLQFPLATEFDRSPKIKDEERPGLDGVDRNVIFHGGWKGQTVVSQTVEFMAQRRLKLA